MNEVKMKNERENRWQKLTATASRDTNGQENPSDPSKTHFCHEKNHQLASIWATMDQPLDLRQVFVAIAPCSAVAILS